MNQANTLLFSKGIDSINLVLDCDQWQWYSGFSRQKSEP